MKFMSNDNNKNNNWLDFSLSRDHINNIGGENGAVPSSSFQPPSHFNYSGIYCGIEGENCALYSSLPVMPLKSDGSLCIMETITRSQPQGMVTSTPKLENFFGVSTMGTQSNESVAMPLSLDSIYYHHNQELDTSSQDLLNHLQCNSGQQQEPIQFQNYPEYSAFRGHDLFQIPQGVTKESHITDSNLHLPTTGDDEISGMKNWNPRNYPTSHAPEQRMSDHGGESGFISAMGYGELQSLSLSMSPSSQSSCVTGSHQVSPAVADCLVMDTKKRGPGKANQKQIVHRKSLDTFGQRTSQYRGVTRHRWTGRYEAHLWDNSCKKEGQSRKGRQVYLGGYDMEEKAARAYDLAALKYWGLSTHINFPLENYQQELEGMKSMTRQEYVANLRRKSSGFSRGASIYRGVTRHHQHGRWQARIGRVAGNKDLYLGTFSTQEEAAEAYDVAAIKFRGANAVTNFDISRYDVESIMASNTLLSGELARRNKEVEPTNEVSNHNYSIVSMENNGHVSDWKMALYKSSQPNEIPGGVEDYRVPSFPVTGHDLLGIESVSSAQQEAIESAKMSNASSLVTSLGSSREGSSERNNTFPMLFGMPPSEANFISTSTNTSSTSWISTSQLRSQVPVFDAWTDP